MLMFSSTQCLWRAVARLPRSAHVACHLHVPCPDRSPAPRHRFLSQAKARAGIRARKRDPLQPITAQNWTHPIRDPSSAAERISADRAGSASRFGSLTYTGSLCDITLTCSDSTAPHLLCYRGYLASDLLYRSRNGQSVLLSTSSLPHRTSNSSTSPPQQSYIPVSIQ
jgi:hypothetical protein